MLRDKIRNSDVREFERGVIYESVISHKTGRGKRERVPDSAEHGTTKKKGREHKVSCPGDTLEIKPRA
jgi:hypothetical protein